MEKSAEPIILDPNAQKVRGHGPVKLCRRAIPLGVSGKVDPPVRGPYNQDCGPVAEKGLDEDEARRRLSS